MCVGSGWEQLLQNWGSWTKGRKMEHIWQSDTINRTGAALLREGEWGWPKWDRSGHHAVLVSKQQPDRMGANASQNHQSEPGFKSSEGHHHTVLLSLQWCYRRRQNQFLQDVQRLTGRVSRRDVLLLMEGFNSKVGSENVGRREVMWQHAAEQMNESVNF